MLMVSLDEPIPGTTRTSQYVARYQVGVANEDGRTEYVDREVDLQPIRLPLGFGPPSGNLLDLIGKALWDRLHPGLRPGGPTDPQIYVKGPIVVAITDTGVDCRFDAAAFEFNPGAR